MATSTKEQTEPVIVTRGGRLDPEAIGWSRAPLQRTPLAGPRLRRKRWEHWAVSTPSCLFLLTLVDLGLTSLVMVGCCDLATGRWIEAARPVRGLRFSDGVQGCDVDLDVVGLRVRVRDDGPRTLLSASARAPFPRIEAELVVERPVPWDTVNVVVPWSEKRFAFTSKQIALPVRGHVTAGRDYPVGDDAFAFLDHGRGVWPWRTRWNWGCGAGRVDGRVVGVNLGARWTDGTGATENGLVVDGRLEKIHEDLRFGLDRAAAPDAPFAIRGGPVDLVFSPLHRKRTRADLGLVAADLDFRIGRFRGSIGEQRVDVFGWAEAFDARW